MTDNDAEASRHAPQPDNLRIQLPVTEDILYSCHTLKNRLCSFFSSLLVVGMDDQIGPRTHSQSRKTVLLQILNAGSTGQTGHGEDQQYHERDDFPWDFHRI